MKIREALSTDAKDVLRLLDQLRGDDHCSRYSEETFFEALSLDEVKVFVAEDGKKIVGIATIIDVPAIRYATHRIIIDELVVDKKARRKGIGTALVKHIFEYAKQNGHHSVWVGSHIDREEAHDFYKKAGFRVYEHNFRYDL